MNSERLAEILGTALNLLIKKQKIKDENLDNFLMEELGIDEYELEDIYSYIEETKG